jgi:CubicO group peptidase (beta-lactamase class C family)
LRRFSIAIAVLLGIVVSPQRTDAQGLPFALFERYLESFRVEAGIPGLSATVSQNGVVLWERGFGRRDIDSGAPAMPDTPYSIGGLTQAFGSTLLLRKCVDQGDVQLDEPVTAHSPFSEPQTTLRQLLSHTQPDGSGYQYSPARFASLTAVVERCGQAPYRALLTWEILDRFAMFDSSPDYAMATPTAADAAIFDSNHLARFADVVGRIATAYRIASGRPQRNGDVPRPRADASDGIISSVRDLVRFDNALGADALLAEATRNAAWTQTINRGGPLPTGLGWFVQNYHGEAIVWQFGLTRGGHSALIVKVPNRGLTYILLANSDGLAAPFNLESGDVTSSLFASLFLRMFVP